MVLPYTTGFQPKCDAACHCRINKKNYRPGNNSSREEVEATLIPFSPCPDPRQAKDIPSSRPTKLRIYPDSGATICPTEKAPVCCPDGWHIVFAGSRFCTDAELRCAPIEGEAAAIAWSLEKCRLFIIGCPNVIVVTDHQPLTGIFGDRDLGKINNPRLFRLKEKCLRYHFTIQHCPGKWHRGADAISRNPVATVESLISICPTNPSPKDIHLSNSRDVAMELAAIQAAVNIDNNTTVITPDHIGHHAEMTKPIQP